jgi:hypothetical protein
MWDLPQQAKWVSLLPAKPIVHPPAEPISLQPANSQWNQIHPYQQSRINCYKAMIVPPLPLKLNPMLHAKPVFPIPIN